MPVSADLFNIVRGSMHDGPAYGQCSTSAAATCAANGAITGRFLQRTKVSVYPEKCIGCGQCLSVCPEHHVLSDTGKRYIAEGCSGCGRCVASPPHRRFR